MICMRELRRGCENKLCDGNSWKATEYAWLKVFSRITHVNCKVVSMLSAGSMPWRYIKRN